MRFRRVVPLVLLVLLVGLSLVVNQTLSLAESSSAERDEGAQRTMVIEKGTVEHGEKVPIPEGFRNDEVKILLSVRSIPDHSQISGRIQCRLKDDGVTAVVRTVKRFENKDPQRYRKMTEENNVLETGTATYLLIARKGNEDGTRRESTEGETSASAPSSR